VAICQGKQIVSDIIIQHEACLELCICANLLNSISELILNSSAVKKSIIDGGENSSIGDDDCRVSVTRWLCLKMAGVNLSFCTSALVDGLP
jgi:hypothetical protein